MKKLKIFIGITVIISTFILSGCTCETQNGTPYVKNNTIERLDTKKSMIAMGGFTS